jgi:peptidoglycan hydrolase CwlO-like protein
VKEKKGFKKYLKIAGYVVGAFIIFFIGAGVGSSGAEITMDEKVMSITELDGKLDKLENNETDLLEDIKSLEKEKKETVALIDDKKKVESELKEIESKLKDTEGALDEELKEGRKKIDEELASANSELKDAQAKLKDTQDKLSLATGQLQKAEGKPKKLGAGTFIVGRDIPTGRYEVTPDGRGSNFFVNDGAKVNTILGDAWDTPSYTFFAEDGDEIKTEEPVTLTPVE